MTAERGGRPGAIVRVTGPVVFAAGLEGARLDEVARVGEAGLLGEIIRLEERRAVIQVFESTTGLRVGEPVATTGAPLSVELGPGLLGDIFDGIQRPLRALAAEGGRPHARPWLRRGAARPALPRDRTWIFEPRVRSGDEVGPGDVLGTVRETADVTHRVLVPPDRRGRVTDVRGGPARVDDAVVHLDGEPVPLATRWPVRRPRPVAARPALRAPLITGQRVLDVLFPLARGGSAVIPGGFGTGKTVAEKTLARRARADIVVYVACGERGNELTDVLDLFEGETAGDRRLADRMVLVANTSNMPIAAREASVYTGAAIAEYYRDQGHHVALLADSTSRWGEALREVSGRLEEMPGEEGYPAYLPARLAEFYERAGEAVCLGADERRGSVTIIGAVSPPGGDFSEPITQHGLRLTGALWALSGELAARRHYPAIDWRQSYTRYELGAWFAERVAPDWEDLRGWARALLHEEGEIQDIVRLLGTDALGGLQRVVLRAGELLRTTFLQQSAFDARDAFTPPEQQYQMLAVLRAAHRAMSRALERGAAVEDALALEGLDGLREMRAWEPGEATERARDLCARLERAAEAVTVEETP